MAPVELGKDASYPDSYDAGLLQPIARELSRADLVAPQLVAFGVDMWNAYELSWLAPNGLPQVAVAEFSFCASNPFIVESKSFKYYLNSLNQTVFASKQALIEVLTEDLQACVGGKVSVSLFGLAEGLPAIDAVPGECIDGLDIEIKRYKPQSGMLSLAAESEHWRDRCFYSHLLKSNCPVTGQPDWATLWLQYSGPAFDKASLLRYLVAFRQYQGFHESCVEHIFHDLNEAFKPDSLVVYARYTRRGGLDINPMRHSADLAGMQPPFRRTVRQ
ncbi:NADPH-dependent 7-cyano-7-deazaguanine reductase QueF [Agaribacterium sp. ZY112]|uniref:NADPH-dependent 7-cyano-7-deazaguanine reductase QueF n=1 Tax=Agaribacterium sp. ZY112 TaxID=3233574 RepID=UPI003525C010